MNSTQAVNGGAAWMAVIPGSGASIEAVLYYRIAPLPYLHASGRRERGADAPLASAFAGRAAALARTRLEKIGHRRNGRRRPLGPPP